MFAILTHFSCLHEKFCGDKNEEIKENENIFHLNFFQLAKDFDLPQSLCHSQS